MKPILFPENATQFNTNGLGRLDCISCTVIEERNGEYTMKMEIAETALHASEIDLCSLIVVKPSDGANLQAFRVYKITIPINGRFTVLAQHISYQLSYIPAMPFTVDASRAACALTLSILKTNAIEDCPFNFSTNVTTVASYAQTLPASIRSRLGGVEGSILDQFGGEYEWDNYNVILHKNRGRTVPNVSLRYGKNITDLNQEANIESTITGIVPYWISSDGETMVMLPEVVIESPQASEYPFKRTVPMDFSQDFEEAPTEEQLKARAQHYVNASGVGIPKVSIKLSFINLADTEEYKNLAAFQTVKLCDNVEVYFERLSIATTAKIVRTEYDVLKEKYISVEIGSLRNTLSGVISDAESSINQVANNTRRMFKNYSNDVKGLVDNATKWLTGSDGYIMARKDSDGNWKELFALDDPDDPHNVLRINVNGIGFSSTGLNGPYTQGWTIDGKMLIGGTNVPSLTVWENPGDESTAPSGKILFQINSSGIQWNAPNSELSTTGTLTIKDSSGNTLGIWSNSGLTIYNGGGTTSDNVIGTWGETGIDVKKGTISGTALKVGTNNSTPGSIYIYNGNGEQSENEVGHWDKNGIDVKKGSITGAALTLGGDQSHEGKGGFIKINNQYGSEIGHWDKDGISVKSGTIEGPSIKVGGDNTHYGNGGTITIYDYSNAEIGHWTKDGIDVKKGTISGTALKIGINNSTPGSIYIYNGNGEQSENEVGHWTKDGIDVKKGTISGAALVLGGDQNHEGRGGGITINNADGFEIGHWTKDGISVKKGSIEGPSIKVGGNSSHAGNGGEIYVYDEAGSEIGHWTKDGISIKDGEIQGPTIKGSQIFVGGTEGGSLNVYNGNILIGSWGSDGIVAYEGTIQGPNIISGGLDNNDGIIAVKDASEKVVVQLDKDGVHVFDGNIEGTDIIGGTITGSVIQSSNSGNRILMDTSATLKGTDGTQTYNYIDMMQSSATNMNICARTELNLMTPTLNVGTEGNVSATMTTNSDHPFRRITSVRKIMKTSADPYYSDSYNMAEGWVPFYNDEMQLVDKARCTLPVLLVIEGEDMTFTHGMVTDSTTFEPIIDIGAPTS